MRCSLAALAAIGAAQAIQLQVAVNSDATYSVLVDGESWLESDVYALRNGGTMLTSAAGLTADAAPAAINGMGPYGACDGCGGVAAPRAPARAWG
jgi:hypothetical protein